MAKTHESFIQHTPIKTASDRSFGLTMGVFFTLISIYGLLKSSWGLVTLGIAALFFALAFIQPEALKPLNVVWTKLGLALHKLTQPIVMFILFFIVLTPFSIVFRKKAQRDLSLKIEKDKKSYWIKKENYAAPKTTMKNQF